jgi:hypothetical protein
MATPPEEVPPKNLKGVSLEIPDPKADLALNSPAQSLQNATDELLAFSADDGWQRYTARLEWYLRRYFKIALFSFILIINIFWTLEITRMLWASGLTGSTFHLSDSVLIALVSTSTANFLGLVVIVARHLFPSDSSK